MGVSNSQQVNALAVIEEEARAVAQFFGVENCDVAAQMLVRRVAGRFGGDKIYVAGARSERERRDREIRRRFTGANFEELEREFGVKKRQLRRILALRVPIEK